MSSTSTGTTTPTSEISSASEHQLITYYSDLGDEVDSHFSRALSSSTSAGTSTRSSNEPQLRDDDYYDSAPISSGPSNKRSRSLSPPPRSSSPQPQSSSSLCSLQSTVCDAIDSSTHNTPNNHTVTSPPHHTATSKDVNTTKLIQPHATCTTKTMTSCCTNRTDTAALTKPPKTIITHPDFSKLLVHPVIDSYSDAPTVPGQPTLSTVTPHDILYIPGITITAYDYQMVTSYQLKQQDRIPHRYASGRGFTQHYTGQSPVTTSQYNNINHQSLNNSGGYRTIQHISQSPSLYIPDNPSTGRHSAGISFNHGFHQSGHTLPLTHNTCNSNQPIELSVDDVQQILAL